MLKENLTTFHILYKSDTAESLINKEAIEVWELKSGEKDIEICQTVTIRTLCFFCIFKC